MSRVVSNLYLHHHLGLGDHIVCNGLVNFLAQDEQWNIKLFCKETNAKNIKQMYQDQQNIEIIDIYGDLQAEEIGKKQEYYIRLGVGLNSNFNPGMEQRWDEVFYEQASIPFTESWSSFSTYIPATQRDVPDKPYAFICNKGSDGHDGIDYTKIGNNLECIYSNQGGFLENINLILNSAEVHCINSAYIHLIDRIVLYNQTKLFYHKNFTKKAYSDFTLKKDWIII